MTTSVEIPADVQPLVAAAIATGRFADEQDLVTEVLKAALPALESYQELKQGVQESVDMADRGEIRDADFSKVRRRLCDEYDEQGGRK